MLLLEVAQDEDGETAESERDHDAGESGEVINLRTGAGSECHRQAEADATPFAIGPRAARLHARLICILRNAA